MNIIRGEVVHKKAVLAPTGELIAQEEKKERDFLEQESQEAFKKGQKYGEKLGYQQANQEAKIFVELMQTMTSKMLEHKNRLLDHLKPEIIEFSLMVCEKIIRAELSDPDKITRLISSLLTLAIPDLKDESVNIVLAAEDFTMIENGFNQIGYNKQNIKKIRFISDSSMRRGDCRIETRNILLNFDISRELEILQSRVLQ